MNKTESKTPLTDGAEHAVNERVKKDGGDDTMAEIWAWDHARKLEIELNELREQVKSSKRDTELLNGLELFLQIGGTSVYQSNDSEPLEDEDFVDNNIFHHKYVVGIEVELENRGCYRYEKMGEAKRLRDAISAALKRWEEMMKNYEW